MDLVLFPAENKWQTFIDESQDEEAGKDFHLRVKEKFRMQK